MNALDWLKKVQQSRLITMKREAMRKLFETVTVIKNMEIGINCLIKTLYLLINTYNSDMFE